VVHEFVSRRRVFEISSSLLRHVAKRGHGWLSVPHQVGEKFNTLSVFTLVYKAQIIDLTLLHSVWKCTKTEDFHWKINIFW